MFKQEQRGAMAGGFENERDNQFSAEEKRDEQMGYENSATEEMQESVEDDISIRTITVKKLPVNKIVFYSLKGEKVYEGPPSAATYHLLTGVESGIYMVAMYADDGTMSTGKVLHMNTTGTTTTTKIFFQTEAEVEALKPKPATTIDELISLVEEAELLLKLKGQDVTQRIRTLRGMFYGTEWGFDFVKADASPMRNIGFSYFLYGTAGFDNSTAMTALLTFDASGLKTNKTYEPYNPTSLFGPDLFDALFNSYEVRTPGGKITDFGHLIIGLEARLSPKAMNGDATDPRGITRGDFNASLGGPGAEVVTWLGDLGGGAFKLASDRVTVPSTPALTIFPSSGSSYGASVNLEGDLAAFLVGAPKQITEGIPELTEINESDGIAGALKNYFNDTEKSWTNRAKNFLTIYGGAFNTKEELTNRDNLISEFAEKIKSFAATYGETRKKDELNNKKKDVNLSEEQLEKVETELEKINDNYEQASNDIAKLFVSALEKTVKDPNRHIAP